MKTLISLKYFDDGQLNRTVQLFATRTIEPEAIIFVQQTVMEDRADPIDFNLTQRCLRVGISNSSRLCHFLVELEAFYAYLFLSFTSVGRAQTKYPFLGRCEVKEKSAAILARK